MRAVIMAGGEGTRLRPLTCTKPKPMVRLCQRPIIEYVLDLLVRYGIDRADITLKYMPDEIISAFSHTYRGIRLNFIVEDEPLGTAGSVRGALGDNLEEVLIVSADALTDIDLSKVIKHHRNSAAHATIVTTMVSDPREFGLVVSDSEGIVTRFVEKPPLCKAVTQSANTGIYILSPEALRLIEPGKACDFASDIFPLMLRLDMKISEYRAQGYWCDVGDAAAYLESTREMLARKVNVFMPPSNVPLGDASQVFNSHFGENVRLGSEVSIRASVIEDGCEVAHDVSITESVVMRDCTIGAMSHISRAIICEGVRIGERVNIFEGAVIGAGAVIGSGSTIKAGARIWPEKQIMPDTVVHESVRFGSLKTGSANDEGYEGSFGAEITPQFCVRLGQAIAFAGCGRRIAVASGDGGAQFCCRNALIAGMMSCGAQVLDLGVSFVPFVSFVQDYCGADIAVYVSGESGVRLSIFERNAMPMRRELERKIENALKINAAGCVNPGEVCYPTGVSGMEEMYLGALLSCAPLGLDLVKVGLRAENHAAGCVLEKALEHLGCSVDSRADFNICLNAQGREISLQSEEERVPWYKVLALSLAGEFQKGRQIAVSSIMPRWYESFAQSLGGSVVRYSTASASEDIRARKIARSQLFTRDGLMAAVKLLYSMKKMGLTMREMLALLPHDEMRTRIVSIEHPAAHIIDRLVAMREHAFAYASDGIAEVTNSTRIRILPCRSGHALRVCAEAYSSETADELCDIAQAAIRSAIDRSGK